MFARCRPSGRTRGTFRSLRRLPRTGVSTVRTRASYPAAGKEISDLCQVFWLQILPSARLIKGTLFSGSFVR